MPGKDFSRTVCHKLRNPVMTTFTAQELLFQRIRELLPPLASLADSVSDILHISADSAYRRIRGETPLVLDEARSLCEHFHLSLDQLFVLRENSVVFRNIRIHNEAYSFDKFISGLVGLLKQINSCREREIIYLTKDVPLMHNFYYSPLIAFRYFFWMKSILQHPGFATRGFAMDCAGPETVSLCRELTREYTRTPAVEIWNSECINSAISQIEFCKGSGFFSSSAEVREVYQSLEETIQHIRAQAEAGVKYIPGEEPLPGSEPYRFFFNRVILGDNTILVTAGGVKTAYLNYDVLNYMSTRDETFCKQCETDLRQLMRKSTLISQTGEKQRNIFFNILLAKIQDRQKNL